MKANLYKSIRLSLALTFIVSVIFVSFDSVQANVILETVSKIKAIINKPTTTQIKTSESDHVLRVSDKSIVKTESVKEVPVLIASSEDDVIRSGVGPLRTDTEEEIVENNNIAIYEVKKGDTLNDIAKIYNITKNTIAWANDIRNGKVKEGDILIILPVSGVRHIVKKGDTVKSLAKKYKADIDDIKEYNTLAESDTLEIGDEIIIPDGQMSIDAPAPKKSTKKKIYATNAIGYFTRPLIGGIKTQGIHGHNAVDIGAKVGTPIIASAGGIVQVARSSGYNGGYGKMVIISHNNGTQTVYGHMSKVLATNGQKVVQGEQIGEVGNTGKSTGPHLHFEIRGATNPF